MPNILGFRAMGKAADGLNCGVTDCIQLVAETLDI